MKRSILLPLLAPLALASEGCHPTPVSEACQVLSHMLPGKVAFNSSGAQGSNSTSTSMNALYSSTQKSYWDGANTADQPGCMVFPSHASDVSIAVKVLNAYPSIPFALKSGGHNWNRGFSSTNGGVLISFRPNMQTVSLSKDQNTVDIGPGAKWREVMAKLDKYGKCAVGGRNDDVGVGGYVILGGLSYLSGQYGFAADGAVGFEAVLANGTIVKANSTHNADLYFALRGGGNNFGILTKFTLLTHPIGQVWGGHRTYTPDKAPALISAMSNFIRNYNSTTTKSVATPNMLWANGSHYWTVNFFHDGPTPPEDVFGEFFNISAIQDKTKTQSYPEILNEGGSANISVGRTCNYVNPVANLPHDNMTDFLQWHYNQVRNASLLQDKEGKFTFLSVAFQPIPVDLQKANAVGSKGALSVDPNGGDKVWIEYSMSWQEESADARMMARLIELAKAAQEYQKTKYAGVKPTQYRSGQLPDVAYNPVFANDAQTCQDIGRSYGKDTYNQLVAARKRYDPDMFFQRRTSGFHLELPQ